MDADRGIAVDERAVVFLKLSAAVPADPIYVSRYSNNGSPLPVISGIVHLRSKALESTILKIFWMLTDAEVEVKIRGARIAFANRRDCAHKNKNMISFGGEANRLRADAHLSSYLFLFVRGERGELIVLCPDQKRYRGL